MPQLILLTFFHDAGGEDVLNEHTYSDVKGHAGRDDRGVLTLGRLFRFWG